MLPFYLEPTCGNLSGYSAIFRRLRGIKVPSPKYYGKGIKIEAMGAAQVSLTAHRPLRAKFDKKLWN
jgi:hypothetical protein